MKRKERRHLKDNEFASFAVTVVDLYEARRTQVIAGVVALVVIVGGYAGYSFWHSRVEARAGTLLTEALIVTETRVGPPADPDAPQASPSYPTERARWQAALTKFKVAADTYPNTDAGILARYLEASTRMSLGFPEQAAASYQQVIDAAGNGSVYGRMARLGLAEAQAQTGKYPEAIATFKELSEQQDSSLPTDAILMQLGRAYRDAGQTAEARQTFNRIVQEFPNSPFSADAQHEIETLETT
jgi:outer membrane protein assembly factor BamD (BamD/ComL family)